jgi:hypothetical protein
MIMISEIKLVMEAGDMTQRRRENKRNVIQKLNHCNKTLNNSSWEK